MEKMWNIRAEIEVEPGDLDLEEGYTKGFMNVVAWADDQSEVQEKLASYLVTFQWKLLSVESVAPISGEENSSSELEEMITRAESNSNAIILGTFHSYRTADA